MTRERVPKSHNLTNRLKLKVNEAKSAHSMARLLRICQTPRVLTNLEAWIRRRLRMYLWRQWENGPKRFEELRRRGVAKFLAAVAAGSPTGFWRMSGHPALQKALRNHVFDFLGLPRIYIAR